MLLILILGKNFSKSKHKNDVRKIEQDDENVRNEQVQENEHSRNNYQNILVLDSVIPKSVHKFFDQRIKEIINEKVAERYSETNKKLADMIDTDLSDYKYY